MQFRPTTYNLFAAACIAIISIANGANAQVPSFAPSGYAGTGVQSLTLSGQPLSYLDKDGKSTQRGKPVNEYLRGNNTRAGYMLKHGNILPGSVRVSVSGRTMRANVDYYLDHATGSLFFMEAVQTRDSVTIEYRYVDGGDTGRSLLGGPTSGLNIKGSTLNFALGLTSTSDKGIDFNTYGLSMQSKFGKGAGLTGMFFTSNASKTNSSNLQGDNWFQPNATNRAALTEENTKGGQLLQQNLSVVSGGLSFRAGIQDVSASFQGFQSLKQANAGNAAMVNELTLLEKEKGIKRTGLGAAMAMNKTSKLSLDWDKINDGGGDIQRQKLGYSNQTMNFSYSTQKVGDKFTKFTSLREADAAQLAKETGIQRNDISFGLTPKKGSSFLFNQNQVSDASGKLSSQGYGLALKGLNFNMWQHSADAGFTRLKDLSDADKTALALDIRKQYDAAATAAQVTAKDKEQITLEAGLKRSGQAISTALGKLANLSFQQFRISDGKGAVKKTEYKLTAKRLQFTVANQEVGREFTKLGAMSDFEKSKLGNETGVKRQSIAGKLDINKQSALTFSQLSIGDEVGKMSRQAVGYITKGLEFNWKKGNTDKLFTRSADLAEVSAPDKAKIEAERGFTTQDLALKLTGMKNFSADLADSSSKNSLDGLFKKEWRYAAAYNPTKRLKISWLDDGNQLGSADQLTTNRTHEYLTMDYDLGKKAKFGFMRDVLDLTTSALASPKTAVELMHFETDQAQKNTVLVERKLTETGDDKFEDIRQIGGKYGLAKNANLTFNRVDIDRGADPGAETNTIALDVKLASGLSLKGAHSETNTPDNKDASAKSIALTTDLGKELKFTGTYNQIEQKDPTVANKKAVGDVGLTTAKPVDLGVLKQAQVSFKYAALNDKQVRQSENVAGVINGMLGKHKLGLEYNGFYDPAKKQGVSRSVIFISDRNAKLPIHFDMLYKSRQVDHSSVQLVRKYNALAKIDALTNLNYSYLSLPEDAAGVMQPKMSSVLDLKRQLTKALLLSFGYTKERDDTQSRVVSKLGGGLAGKLAVNETVEVGYSVDVGTIAGTHADSHTLRLGYDRQIDGDNYVTFNCNYVMYKGSGFRDDLVTSVEFRTRF
jgi:hypothetical protein